LIAFVKVELLIFTFIAIIFYYKRLIMNNIIFIKIEDYEFIHLHAGQIANGLPVCVQNEQ